MSVAATNLAAAATDFWLVDTAKDGDSEVSTLPLLLECRFDQAFF